MYQYTDTPFKFITSTVVAIDSQTTIPFMLKNLIKVLLPVADKWKDLGEILCVTENILDEIFTNNEAHEACLREMLRYYMMRSDLHRDWKEISSALRKLGEETLANNIDQGQFCELEWLLSIILLC